MWYEYEDITVLTLGIRTCGSNMLSNSIVS